MAKLHCDSWRYGNFRKPLVPFLFLFNSAPAAGRKKPGYNLISKAAAVAAAIVLYFHFSSVASADWDYWITKGNSKVVNCEGNTTGSFVKLANLDGRWIYIDGIATCKDGGQDYIYNIDFIRISINGVRLDDITRETLNFDWIGLAVYRPETGQQRIDWMYDKAQPIQGALPKASSKRISFGGIEFRVPKSIISRATRFTFYLTAQGVPFTFGAL